MIRGILIDIDNTLYDYDSVHRKAMEAAYNIACENIDLDTFKSAFIRARDEIHSELKDTAASHNRLLYFQRTLEILETKDILFAKKLYDTYWNIFLENMVLFDSVIDFFESNKDKKICFLTDLTAYIQYRKIEILGLEKYAFAIVTSEEAGIEKPGSKMFELGLKKLGLRSCETCMIGDSYKKDIIGALEIGIKPYWKTDRKSENPNIITFNNFKELIGKI